MTNLYPRETVEYVRFKPVVVEGVTYSAYDYALTTRAERPTGWLTPITVGADKGFLLAGLDAGVYTAWVKVISDPEVIVINAGQFRVT